MSSNSLRSMYKARSRSKSKDESTTSSRRKSRGLERKQKRDDEVNKRRLMSDDMSPIVEDHDHAEERKYVHHEKATTRTERLKQWREERKRKMEEEKKNSKKPMFKVSHLQYQGETDLYKLTKGKPNMNFTKEGSSKASAPTKFNAKPVASNSSSKINRTSTARKQVKPADLQKAVVVGLPKAGNSHVSGSHRIKTSQSTTKASALVVEKTRPSTRNSAKASLVTSEVKSKPNTRQRRNASDLCTKLTASAAAKAKSFEKPKEFLRAKPHRVTRSRTQTQKEVKTTDKKPAGSKKNKNQITHKEIMQKADIDREKTLGIEMPAVKPDPNESESNGSPLDGGQDLHLSDSAVATPKHSTPTVTRASSAKKLSLSHHKLSGIPYSSRRRSRRSKKSGSALRRLSKNLSIIYATTEIAMGDECLEQHEVSLTKVKCKAPVVNIEAREEEGTLEKDLEQDLREWGAMTKETFPSEDIVREKANYPGRKSLGTSTPSTDASDTNSFDSNQIANDKFEKNLLEISNKENMSVKKPRGSKISGMSNLRSNETTSTPQKTRQNNQETDTEAEIKEEDTGSVPTSAVRSCSVSSKRRCSQRLTSTSEDNSAAFSTDEMRPTPSKRPRRSVVKPVSRNCNTLNIFHLDDVSKEDKQISSVEYPTPISQQRVRMSSAVCKRRSLRHLSPISNQGGEMENKETQAPLLETTSASLFKNEISGKEKRKSKRLIALGKHLVDESELDTQSPTPEPVTYSSQKQLSAASSISKRKSLRLSNLQSSVTDEATGSENKTGTDESQMLKPSRRQSRQVRCSSVRRSGLSTVVSVSDEGTNKVIGENVVDKACAPAVPTNHHENGTSVLSSEMVNTSEVEQTSDVIYHVGKPAESETENRVLQELPVEKLGEDLSYIEVPLDDSLNKSRSASPPKYFSDTATEQGSQSTEPFTPRKSGEVSTLNQSSPLAKTPPSAAVTNSAKTPTATEPVQSSSISTTPLSSLRRGRSVAPTPNFKTPGQPFSAFKTKSERRRRKTEHSTPSKSPEEMIEILKKSPMIEMTRRRSRHISSPASTYVNPVNFDGLFAELSPNQLKSNKCAPDLPETNASVLDATVKTNADSAATSNTHPTSTTAPIEPTETLLSTFNPSGAEKVKPFRDLLIKETDRLNEMCNKWSEISSLTPSVGEDIQGQIRSTIGKAQLLMNQRFKQFSGLVDDCAFGRGEKETTVTDLQGFWEMIYFQVNDVDKLFANLSALQQNEWKEQQEVSVKNIVKKKAPVKVSKPKIKSNFAAFRMELMKRKAQASTKVNPSEKEEESTKEFDAGFFKVTSPVRSPSGRKSVQNTPLKPPSTTSLTTALGDNQTETANEEPYSNSSHPITPTSKGKENATLTTPNNSRLMAMSAKRLSYVPVVPSPLLNDITGLQLKKTL